MKCILCRNEFKFNESTMVDSDNYIIHTKCFIENEKKRYNRSIENKLIDILVKVGLHNSPEKWRRDVVRQDAKDIIHLFSEVEI